MGNNSSASSSYHPNEKDEKNDPNFVPSRGGERQHHVPRAIKSNRGNNSISTGTGKGNSKASHSSTSTSGTHSNLIPTRNRQTSSVGNNSKSSSSQEDEEEVEDDEQRVGGGENEGNNGNKNGATFATQASSSSSSSSSAFPQREQERYYALSQMISHTSGANLLGEEEVRRLARAFRRMVAVNQSLSSSSGSLSTSNTSTGNNTGSNHNGVGTTGNNSSSNASYENRYTSNGIYCYDGISGGDFLVLEDETEEECLELDGMMCYFFPGFLPEKADTQRRSVIGGGGGSNNIKNSNPNTPGFVSNLYMEYFTFRHFMVPGHAHTPPGVMECIFYSMATNAPSLATSSSGVVPNNQTGTGSSRGVIRLPDLVSFFGILKRGSIESRGALSFRVYQSIQYLRAGNRNNNSSSVTTVHLSTSSLQSTKISRNTISNFVYNLYGQEMSQSDEFTRLLNDLFYQKKKNRDGTQTVVSQVDLPIGGFVKGVMEGVGKYDFSHVKIAHAFLPEKVCLEILEQNTHLLTAWLETLSSQMFPQPASPSVVRLEETHSRPGRALQLMCARHRLTPLMLLECKRKFYGMLALSSQHHVSTTNDPAATSLDENADASSSSPISTKQQPTKQHPTEKVLNETIWYRTISAFLPEALATLTFRAGCRDYHPVNTNLEKQNELNEKTGNAPSFNGLHRTYSSAAVNTAATKDQEPNNLATSDTNECLWTLYDFVTFGCTAVRGDLLSTKGATFMDEDLPLMKFVFTVFLQGTTFDHNYKIASSDFPEDDLSLSRDQVGRMLLLLLEHAAFRRDPNEHKKHNLYTKQLSEEQTLVNASDAIALSFIPPDEAESEETDSEVTDSEESQYETQSEGTRSTQSGVYKDSNTKITLSSLVDLTLNETTTEKSSKMTFSQFYKWHIASQNNPYHRLHPFLMELRLIAGAIFGVRPSTPAQERDIVLEIAKRHRLRHPSTSTSPCGPQGTTWYLVAKTWMNKWNIYTTVKLPPPTRHQQQQQNIIPPPPIDNNPLLRTGSLVLKSNLHHVRDFDLVAPLMWNALQSWHDGGPPIYRKVVSKRKRVVAGVEIETTPISSGPKKVTLDNELELYPFCLTVSLADATTGDPRPFQQWQLASRTDPASALIDELCKSLNTDPEKARLWKMPSHTGDASNEKLLDLSKSLGDQYVDDGGVLMLELQGENGWIKKVYGQPLGLFDQVPTIAATTSQKQIPPAEIIGDGIVGLHNMGNTCYLNASIQCLSHTPLLRQYFTQKSYLSDINTTNPLGQQGRLAQVSASLVCQLWKHGNSGSALTPKSFKEAIGKFNEDFSGNEQHDAQELLAFLLGGLSEDLNRIQNKPYTEQPDSDGRPDRELADIWWKNHLRREMSIIVALFTGQYKSLLTCNECAYESARFEPFAFLQLPLPEDDLVPVNLILFPIHKQNKVMKYSVRVHKDGTVEDALIALVKIVVQDQIDNDENANTGIKNYNGIASSPYKHNSDQSDSVSSGSTNTTTSKDEEDFYLDLASNLAVVDMRECRINSITPSTRSLSQLRESDVLCVFELESLPEVVGEDEDDDDEGDEISISGNTSEDTITTGETDTSDVSDEEESSIASSSNHTTGEKTSSDSRVQVGQHDTSQALPVTTNMPQTSPVAKPITPPPARLRPDYIALLQRRLEPVPKPFLHPFCLRVFGTPLLVRLYLKDFTGRELYDFIASRMERYIPTQTKEINKQLIVQTEEQQQQQSQRTTPARETTTSSQEIPPPTQQHAPPPKTITTKIEMESVAGGPLPRHHFRLRLSSRDGKRCSKCPWFECCIGCTVPDDDQPVVIKDGDSVALDWHLSSALSQDKPGASGAVASPAKEQSLALASVERHSTCKWEGKDITLEECLDSFAKEEEIPEAFCSKCKDFRCSKKKMSLWRLPPIMIIHLKRFQFTQHFRRKLRNMVVFPTEGLDLSRIVACDDGNSGSPFVEEKDEANKKDSYMPDHAQGAQGDDSNNKQQEQNNMNGVASTAETTQAECHDDGDEHDASWIGSTDGQEESLYDLYGVVHHLGALTGGHYVASLKSEIDGKWRIFNDAQVTEVDSKDIIDASAYILFYVRKDVKSANLKDLWDTSSRVGEGITEEQIDKLVKQRERCVIS